MMNNLALKDSDTETHGEDKTVEYYKSQLDSCQKKLARVERQLDKSERYNEDLRKELEKLSAELHEYRSSNRSKVDVAVQTEDSEKLDGDSVSERNESGSYPENVSNISQETQSTERSEVAGTKQPSTSTAEQQPTTSTAEQPTTSTAEQQPTTSSIAEELKSAAQEAVSQSGYVYDERTGLYYDYNSGYYYDAEKSLFYDPNSGTYFYFNSETQEYTFHSKVDLSQYTAPYYGYYKNNSYQDYDQTSQSSATWAGYYNGRQQRHRSPDSYHGNSRHQTSSSSRRKGGSKSGNRHTSHENKENRHSGHREGYSPKRRSRSEDKARKKESSREKENDRRKTKKRKKKVKVDDSDAERKRTEKKRKKEKRKERKKKRKEKERKVEEEDMDTREQVYVIDSTECQGVNNGANKDVDGGSMEAESEENRDSDVGGESNIPSQNVRQLVQREDEIDLTDNRNNNCRAESTSVKEASSISRVCKSENPSAKSTVVFPSDSEMTSEACEDERTETEQETLSQTMEISPDTFNSGKQFFSDQDRTSGLEACASSVFINPNTQTDLISQTEETIGQESCQLSSSKNSSLTNTDDSSLSSESSMSSSSRSLCTGESELESGELSESDGDKDSVVIESVVLLEEEEEDDDDEEEEDEDEEQEDSDCQITGVERQEYQQYEINDDTQAQEIGGGCWPPCIRVIVTDSDCLDPGSLFIVTCDGAQIGREKEQGNAIIIPDLNVSKVHATITYNAEQQQYVITDHGSQNGTYVNECRISEAKTESKPVPLSHGTTLQFSCTRMLLHIHPGTDTCDECEPGLVQAALAKQVDKEVYTILSKEEKVKQQRQNLKQMKKKYGLQNSSYVDNVAALNNPSYQDKAEERRRTKGSDNPYIPDEAPASVNRPIAESNLGHKLLKKMGWTEGESLGKDNEGIQQPITASFRVNQKAGLGSSLSGAQTLDNVSHAPKVQKNIQARLRFQKEFQESGQQQDSTAKNDSPIWVKGETQTF